MQRLTMMLCFIFIIGCVHSEKLSESEMNKLDSAIKSIIGTDGKKYDSRCDTLTDEHGKIKFGVIIKSSDFKVIKQSGIVLNSTIGEISTSFLSIEEIKTIAKLESVTSIKCGTKNTLQ